MSGPWQTLLEATDIPPARLAWILVPLVLTWWLFRRQGVGLEKRLATGALRAVVQLSALGFVLVPLFGMGETPLVLLVLGVMCALAAFFSLGLLGKGPGLALWPQAVLAILPVVAGLTAFALTAVIPERGLLDPRYALSLAGMLAGVSMNGVALAGERFLTATLERRSEIEWHLLLGGNAHESTRSVRAAALRVAVTPSLNSLVAVGLVSIPGMMSGQVIAGGDPLVAARYQMMIMGLWVSAATLAPSLFLLMLPARALSGHRVHGAPEGAARPAFRLTDLPAPPVPEEDPTVLEERPEDGCGPQVFGERNE